MAARLAANCLLSSGARGARGVGPGLLIRTRSRRRLGHRVSLIRKYMQRHTSGPCWPARRGPAGACTRFLPVHRRRHDRCGTYDRGDSPAS